MVPHCWKWLTKSRALIYHYIIKFQYFVREYSVVIAIIAILAAMLLPALSKARAKGQSTVCTNNYKQIYTSAMIYSDNYNGYLPYWNNKQAWGPLAMMFKTGHIDIRKKGASVVSCPLYKEHEFNFTSNSAHNGRLPHYLWNKYTGYITNKNVVSCVPVTWGTLKNVSKTVLMTETTKSWMEGSAKNRGCAEPDMYVYKSTILERFHDVKFRKSLIADGSVLEITVERFDTEYKEYTKDPGQ